jgi:hypothetical protein
MSRLHDPNLNHLPTLTRSADRHGESRRSSIKKKIMIRNKMKIEQVGMARQTTRAPGAALDSPLEFC